MNGTENNKTTRVLHVLNDKKKRFVLFENLVEGLKEQGFEQTICCLYGDADLVHPLERQFGVVSLRGKKPRSFRPDLVFELSRIIVENRIDIVHCQRHKAAVYGTLAAWAAGGGVKAVATVHGRGRTRNWGRKLANYLLFKKISKIISVSDSVRQDILKTNAGLSPAKVSTVYNGIDAERFSLENADPEKVEEIAELREGGTVFGTVGRLSPVKGQSLLLEAFQRLERRCPDVALVLVGSGPLEEELKKRAKETIRPGRVRFLGYRSDIPDILAAIDCFVLPSLSEGHPLSLLEAMACERIAVASRVGGVPEILSSPEIGFTAKPGCVDSLATAMERVCRMDEDERAAMGRRAREAVLENFTTGKMVSATAELYRSLVSQAAAKATGNQKKIQNGFGR